MSLGVVNSSGGFDQCIPGHLAYCPHDAVADAHRQRLCIAYADVVEQPIRVSIAQPVTHRQPGGHVVKNSVANPHSLANSIWDILLLRLVSDGLADRLGTCEQRRVASVRLSERRTW